MIHNLLLTEEDIYSIATLRDMTKNCIFLQVPEDYSNEDVEAQGCIHLGRFASH
jgi:hypothetical protein